MRSILYNRLFFVLYFVILIISMTGLSLDSVTWRTLGYNSSYVSVFQLGILIPGLLITLSCIRAYMDQFTGIIWGFCLFCLITIFFNIDSLDNRSIIAVLFNIFIIPLGISSGKYLTDTITISKRSEILYMCLQIPAIVSAIFLLKLGFKFDSDCAFAVFLYMPLVFFIKANMVRIGFLILYGVIILLAGKRSIFLTFTLCTIIYLFYILSSSDSKSSNRNIKRALFLTVFLTAIYLLISNYASQIDYISDRFSAMQEDKGSGREDIYSLVVNDFYNSDWSNQLFGHGYFGVVNSFHIGAHNDFFEILYDYGIIALILYFIFMCKLLLYTINKYLRRKEYGISTSILAMNTSIILILGVLNCMIVSTFFQFISYCALGMALRTIQNKY